MKQLKERRQLQEKKQTCKQKQIIKNNIKNGRSMGHERRYCYTSQADRFCDKLSRKKSKSEPRKLTIFSSHTGAAYIELKTTYQSLVFKLCTQISFYAWCVQPLKNYFNGCALESRQQGQKSYPGSFSTTHVICTFYKETRIFHKNPFNKSLKVRLKNVTTLGKNKPTKLLFTMTSETNKHLRVSL